ncbi:class I SAM-dependent methyltransferase [Novosphingobium lentum]|uniref:class I SAM-dependent methyltransferase n=1 Tax=Novosphingobium lentum TaxID=145287 RepID=UPI000A5B22C2|nr:class I SAM-dependent methyltransferase [Novosphingobium lentum]
MAWAIELGKAGDFKGFHVNVAMSHAPLSILNVLVVGCNRGEDCRIFVDSGAASVVGVDLLDEIGVDYRHPSTSYVCASVEELPFETDRFDLVFAYATLEHVQNIYSAFREMARVCRPGGIVYSASAPLWNSRYGPHWGEAFHDLPWAHLLYRPAEIIEFNRRRREGNAACAFPHEAEIRYWLHDGMFNKRPSLSYLNACRTLDDIEIIRNDLELEDPAVLSDDLYARLSVQGFSREELLALTHIFIGRKTAPPTRFSFRF